MQLPFRIAGRIKPGRAPTASPIESGFPFQLEYPTLKQYQAVIDQVIPTRAPEEMSEKIDPGPGWSQDRSEQLLFERIAREDKREQQKAGEDARPRILSSHALPHPFQFSSTALWQRLWVYMQRPFCYLSRWGSLRIRLAHGEP
jgi:hypothetical protein